MDEESEPDGRYRAVLLTITRAGTVGEDLMPFVKFRANFERREVRAEDEVAIFNVHGTSSHFVVFLDEDKTMEELTEELEPYNVVLSQADIQRIETKLETKALLKEALGED